MGHNDDAKKSVSTKFCFKIGFKINKGDLIGLFVFGGSAVLLLTNNNIKLDNKITLIQNNNNLNKYPIKLNIGNDFGSFDY